jgi:hypothetical protein
LIFRTLFAINVGVNSYFWERKKNIFEREKKDFDKFWKFWEKKSGQNENGGQLRAYMS